VKSSSEDSVLVCYLVTIETYGSNHSSNFQKDERLNQLRHRKSQAKTPGEF
jgi:hypothetical protein